jgi:hypothetical protein
MKSCNILFKNHCLSVSDRQYLDLYKSHIDDCDEVFAKFQIRLKKLTSTKNIKLFGKPIIVIAESSNGESSPDIYSRKLRFGVQYTFKNKKLDIEIVLMYEEHGGYKDFKTVKTMCDPYIVIPKSESSLNKNYWKCQERHKIECYQKKEKYNQIQFLDWFAK